MKLVLLIVLGTAVVLLIGLLVWAWVWAYLNPEKADQMDRDAERDWRERRARRVAKERERAAKERERDAKKAGKARPH